MAVAPRDEWVIGSSRTRAYAASRRSQGNATMGRRYVARPPPTDLKRGSAGGEQTSRASTSHASLGLLGGFQLAVDGESIYLPRCECRVLASVALRDRAQTRVALAGRLWPDTTNDRALGRLRTALWRLRRTGRRLLDVTHGDVALDPDVAVDVRELTELAHRTPNDPRSDDGALLELLSVAGELLPDWDDDWVIADRERIRQMRLNALEQLSEQLANEGRFGPAVDAALMAIADDPLRESARRTLIRVHMAQGNVHDALGQYAEYRDVMREDLGLAPSPQMELLLDELGLRGSDPQTSADPA